MTFSRSLKFNPYHDKLGRFTTADNAVRTSAWQSDFMDYSESERQILRNHSKTQKAYLKNGGTPGTRYDVAQKGDRLPLGDLMGALAIYGAHQRSIAEQHNFLYGGTEEFVLAEGREHDLPKTPPVIPLGEAKQCYKNAADFVMQSHWSREEPDRYKYVEGYFMDTRIPIPIEHAYVLDTKTNTVIDPTLGWAPTARYIGVEFSYAEMAKHLAKNKYYGLLSNGISPNPIVFGKDPDFKYRTQKEDTAMYRQVLKYNPNHYPAGTPGGKGGQFAPSKNKGGGKDVIDAHPAGELLVNQRAQIIEMLRVDPDSMNDAVELALRWSGNMKDVTETVSEEEYQARKARLEAALAKQKATEDQQSWLDHYTETPPDNPKKMIRRAFTEERRALHDQIFEKMMRTGWTTKNQDGTETFHRPAIDYQVKDGTPTVLHLGGRAGAGKSFLGKDGGVYARDKFFVVDPDDIKMMLPEYDRETTNIVHEESSYLADRIREACRRLGCNFVSDKTMGKVGSIKGDVDAVAKSPKGYIQEAHIITVPRAISMMRAIKRWNEGGRLVPPEVVWSMTGMEAAAEYVVSKESRITRVTIWNGFTESGRAELHFERGPLIIDDTTQKGEFGTVLKFNPNHYPAGTSGGKGGQFAPSKNKAGGGAKEAKPRSSFGYSSKTRIKNGVVYTSDVLDAVKALHEGKKVQLRSVKQVSTLLDKLAAIAQEAIAAGKKAKTYDLCQVTVKGSNLFCAQSKNIPRIEMPQLKGFPVKGSMADKLPRDERGEVDLSAAFREHLEKKLKVKIEDTTEKAAYMKASQNELNGVKVSGIAGAIRNNKLADERIFISKDNYVVDGHHRWAAMVGVDSDDGKLGDLTLPVARVDMDIIELLKEANDFAERNGLPRVGVAKSACGCETKFTSVMKFNPYHDRLGRFTTAFNATYISAWGKAYMEKFRDSDLKAGFLNALGRNHGNFESAQLSAMLARAYGATDSELRNAVQDMAERMRSQLGIKEIAPTYTGHDDRKWSQIGNDSGGLPDPPYDVSTYNDRRKQIHGDDPYVMDYSDKFQRAFWDRHEKFLSDLSSGDRYHLESYTGSGYGPLNKNYAIYTKSLLNGDPKELNAAGYEMFSYADKWMSYGAPPTDDVYRQHLAGVDAMDRILRGQELGDDIVLRRNMPDTYLLNQLGLSDTARVMDVEKDKAKYIGRTYVETATAMSTSTNLGLTLKMSMTGKMAILRIRAPKETKGLYVASISGAPDEREVLLPRGTTFVIRDIGHVTDQWGYKNLVVDVDLVSQPYLSLDPVVAEAKKISEIKYPTKPLTKAEKDAPEGLVITPACKSCRWRNADQATCKAYPKGIPAPILLGMFRHKYPLYGLLGPTDHGISYAPIDKQIKH